MAGLQEPLLLRRRQLRRPFPLLQTLVVAAVAAAVAVVVAVVLVAAGEVVAVLGTPGVDVLEAVVVVAAAEAQGYRTGFHSRRWPKNNKYFKMIKIRKRRYGAKFKTSNLLLARVRSDLQG